MKHKSSILTTNSFKERMAEMGLTNSHAVLAVAKSGLTQIEQEWWRFRTSALEETYTFLSLDNALCLGIRPHEARNLMLENVEKGDWVFKSTQRLERDTLTWTYRYDALRVNFVGKKIIGVEDGLAYLKNGDWEGNQLSNYRYITGGSYVAAISMAAQIFWHDYNPCERG